jgi:truncated hemoglobin YjbI
MKSRLFRVYDRERLQDLFGRAFLFRNDLCAAALANIDNFDARGDPLCHGARKGTATNSWRRNERSGDEAMTWNKLIMLGGVACLGAISGCDEDDAKSPDAAVVAIADAGVDAAVVVPKVDAGSDVALSSLYDRLGGAAGINTVITDFVVNRVLQDSKINGYFLNSTVDGGNVIRCLNLQVGSATGGKEVYPAPGCRDMKAAHRGMGVSKVDFDDLVGHLVAALTAAGVSAADISAIAGVLLPMQADIVEDVANNKTVYQRVGRKPAVIAVIDKFVGRVAADARINGFFNAGGIPRLKTCLVRQVASIDGPVKYGQEVTTNPANLGAELGVSSTAVCKDMLSVHKTLTNPAAGGNGARGIGIDDFGALVEDLVNTFKLDFPTVPKAEVDAILGALAPLCSDIVAGPGCSAMAFGLTTDNKLVKFDVTKPADVSTPMAFSGLSASETVLAITVRPKTGKLFALGSTSRLYEVNTATGAVTQVGTGVFATLTSGAAFGFDFNPTVDRIRLTSDTEQSLRLHPDMGTVAATDTALAPAGNVVAVSYTNSRDGATMTTLFGIDSATDKRIRIGGPDGVPSPNTGAITDVGQLGFDTSANVGFDIRAPMNIGYAVLEVAGKSALFTVSLTTGAASKVGDLGGSSVLRSIALAQ